MEPCADCGSIDRCKQDTSNDRWYCAPCWQKYEGQHVVRIKGRLVVVEVALRNADGEILALVLRNADGAFGRHMVAQVCAGVLIDLPSLLPPLAPSHIGRTVPAPSPARRRAFDPRTPICEAPWPWAGRAALPH